MEHREEIVDQAMLWITFVGMIVLPIAGSLINSLITKKLDEQKNDIKDLNEKISSLEDLKEKNKNEILESMNGQRSSFESKLKDYVREDMYKQALEFHTKNSDDKFKSLLAIMTTQFENVEGKIDDLKDLINDKLNGKKHE